MIRISSRTLSSILFITLSAITHSRTCYSSGLTSQARQSLWPSTPPADFPSNRDYDSQSSRGPLHCRNLITRSQCDGEQRQCQEAGDRSLQPSHHTSSSAKTDFRRLTIAGTATHRSQHLSTPQKFRRPSASISNNANRIGLRWPYLMRIDARIHARQQQRGFPVWKFRPSWHSTGWREIFVLRGYPFFYLCGGDAEVGVFLCHRRRWCLQGKLDVVR